jgi:serine/threonine protein kinase
VDRWETLERTYNTASELRGEDRARFLAGACANDDAMRRQVEALLAHTDARESVLDRPATELAAALMTDTDAAGLTGRRIGPYEILELIGSGGMGQVYRARDLRLARDVALKVLPSYFVADSDRLARFRREAQTLAAVITPTLRPSTASSKRTACMRWYWSSSRVRRSRAGSAPEPFRSARPR